MRRRLVAPLFASLVLSTAAAAEEVEPAAANASPLPTPVRQTGKASFYAQRLDGRRTASGERYDPHALTAAHRTLPMGTRVRVVNPGNDRSVVVTVNDRGPVPKGRMIDLSAAAADRLGIKRAGVARVQTEVVGTEPVSGAAPGSVDGKDRGAR